MLLHPLMLAWMAGAAVPLVLHLLSRSQYRPVQWGAMMFLTGIDAGPRYSARFKQAVLLALRMVLLGLLAVALARPVVASRYNWIPTAGLTTGGPAAVVLILDDSASMGYQQNGKSRFDQAREVTLQILSSLKRGDQAALLLAGAREYQPAVPPNADLQSIAARVADLEPDTGEADFAPVILRAAELLQHAAPANREIYVICDRQALSWRNMTDAFRQQWNARRGNGPAPRLTVIPVGGEESDNIAVNSIEVPGHAAIRNQQTIALLHVHNYGAQAAAAVPVSVWTGARSVLDTTIAIPAHETRTLSVPIRFFESGSRILSAAVQTSGLTSDDRLDYAMDVVEPARILLVSGETDTAASRPVDDPASLAWPGPQGRKELAALVTATVPIQQFNAASLHQIGVVVLDHAAQFSQQQIEDLKTFVRSGGGVVLLPDEKIPLDQYNNGLCANDGIFPATISPPLSRPLRINYFDHQHPIFRFLSDRMDVFGRTSIVRFFPIISRAPNTRVLARFNDNLPFVLESTVERGHVFLVTAVVDHHAPAALLQSIIRYLALASVADCNLQGGQPIVAVTDDPVEDRSATVQFLSGGQRQPAVTNHLPGRTEIHFYKTAAPGTYRLRYRTGGREKLLNYVVSAGHPDSDLTPLTSEQWEALGDRISFDRVDLSRTTVAEAMDVQRGGREIWIELLGGVLLLMMVEMLVSRWWSVG